MYFTYFTAQLAEFTYFTAHSTGFSALFADFAGHFADFSRYFADFMYFLAYSLTGHTFHTAAHLTYFFDSNANEFIEYHLLSSVFRVFCIFRRFCLAEFADHLAEFDSHLMNLIDFAAYFIS